MRQRATYRHRLRRRLRISFSPHPLASLILVLANGRIPAIVDKTSGTSKRVFEGAAIQLYLCAKYDKDFKISFPYDSDEYWECVEWMVWLQSGIGPMQGQGMVPNQSIGRHDG